MFLAPFCNPFYLGNDAPFCSHELVVAYQKTSQLFVNFHAGRMVLSVVHLTSKSIKNESNKVEI